MQASPRQRHDSRSSPRYSIDGAALTSAEAGQEIFSCAGKKNDAERARALHDGAELEWRHPVSGRTPLIQAASLGREALVQVLLEVGAQRDAVDKDGRTARDLAIAGKHLAVVALLEGRAMTPAEVEAVETAKAMTKLGKSLRNAVEKGDHARAEQLLAMAKTPEAVQLLLEASKPPPGSSQSMLAASSKHAA